MSLLAMGVVTGAGQARADSADEFPAEEPPAGYTGLQYVDSRGCAYARAVRDGSERGTNEWVVLRKLDRTPVCGLRPSPARADFGSSGSDDLPAWALANLTDPVVKVTCRSNSGKSYSYIAMQGDRITCPNAQAHPEDMLRVAAADLTGAAMPDYALPGLPEGYGHAFGYDRRVSNRDRSQDLPRQLVSADAGDFGLVIDGYRSNRTQAQVDRVSSKQGPSAIHRNLQVGAFRSMSSAEKAARRLNARGIAARIVAVESDGRKLQIVLAGPFDTEAQTRSVLATAQAAGYTNAYMRR